MRAAKLMWIVWPAFLAACTLEGLVFAVVDPLELHWAGQALGWSRQGTYAAAFFLFWAVSAGACALTALLQRGPGQLDRAAVPASDAPGAR
jgi:hypothetical protein